MQVIGGLFETGKGVGVVVRVKVETGLDGRTAGASGCEGLDGLLAEAGEAELGDVSLLDSLEFATILKSSVGNDLGFV